MSRRKNIRSKQQFDAALELEKAGDMTSALKGYQKAVTTDPLNSHAWNRQMVIYRKTRLKEDEVKLIQTAISQYQKSAEAKQQEWLTANHAKADSTRELATVLGLLEPTGLPRNEDVTIEKWQTRLYLLEYRIKNAKKKKIAVKNPKVNSTKQSSLQQQKKAKSTTAPKAVKKER